MSKAHHNLPEITFKAIGLSLLLTILLAAANAYLGLKVGITISASIPAAVISMACLKLFRRHNILENNIVQTAASSGEALTAGIIFTVPALIVLKYWQQFYYYELVIIAALGGTLGVLFSVPLRRVLLADKSLPFPEGNAIGNVLQASTMEGFGVRNLVYGGIIGASVQICQLGLKIFADSAQFWLIRYNLIFGIGIGFNPALIGAGYIIGINIALSILLGIILGWVVGLPIIAGIYGVPDATSTYAISMALWDQYIRYIGLGVMMIGGFWAVILLIKPMSMGIIHSIRSLTTRQKYGWAALSKEERDLPINFVGWLILLIVGLIFLVLQYVSGSQVFGFSMGKTLLFNGLNTVYILLGGFIFSSICAYFAGLVGSSANPLSSISLIALIFAALLIAFFIGPMKLIKTDELARQASAVAIIVTAFVAGAAAISNDTIQDLKAGQIVGATPWKQQLMLVVGVLVSALIIPLVLQLLFDAYGMAGVFPHPHMDPTQMLLAPQASLMAALVQGVFTQNLNVQLLEVGAVIAIIVLIFDQWLRNKGIRIPVLAVGLGIYLPVSTSSPLVLGGILAWWVKRQLNRKYTDFPLVKAQPQLIASERTGLLIASGLVAGAAITGVLLAIPFVLLGNSNALRIIPATADLIPQLLSILTTWGLFMWFKHRVLAN